MKFTLILTSLFAVAFSAPTNLKPNIAFPCHCKPVFCPLELIAVRLLLISPRISLTRGQECKCKKSAAEGCYQAALANGVQCAKPDIVS
jgi:hypothetical protein